MWKGLGLWKAGCPVALAEQAIGHSNKNRKCFGILGPAKNAGKPALPLPRWAPDLPILAPQPASLASPLHTSDTGLVLPAFFKEDNQSVLVLRREEGHCLVLGNCWARQGSSSTDPLLGREEGTRSPGRFPQKSLTGSSPASLLPANTKFKVRSREQTGVVEIPLAWEEGCLPTIAFAGTRKGWG